MKKNNLTQWLNKSIWAMFLIYIIGITYLLATDKQANLFLFISTITSLFILGLVTFIAYMIAMRE